MKPCSTLLRRAQRSLNHLLKRLPETSDQTAETLTATVIATATMIVAGETAAMPARSAKVDEELLMTVRPGVTQAATAAADAAAAVMTTAAHDAIETVTTTAAVEAAAHARARRVVTTVGMIVTEIAAIATTAEAVTTTHVTKQTAQPP